ncbi:UvrD-helicase domain-containing protein [Desertivirga xinjiangensis]|uniref:UvrD-helicase domain-containing protein n=1 Tax=Desertivirga xinjiangensis TaxID=539206 RepID=UPI0021094359|nr:UvrD-helicase domain-containing protein [Pedobacter xinjiangensis]
MPRKNRNNIPAILKVVIFCISIVGIWFLYEGWLNRKKVKHLLTLRNRLRDANAAIDKLLNFEKYFSFRDEQSFVETFKDLRKLIAPGFHNLESSDDYISVIKQFVNTFDTVSSIRRQYNNEFVEKEAAVYAYLFNSLEQYPLSGDQVEAIVRDEDNNLVIAGAGTGKTTTIAGKVAYLLEKGLAKPDELLIISFTKNAVIEMKERCMRFCRNIPDIDQLDIRTFNSFGYLVKRHCSSDELHLAFNGDDQQAKVFLQETFDRLFLTDRSFQKKAVNFLAFFDRPERDEFDFKTRNDFIKHEKSFKNVTLDGITVNSKEELKIANFFCLFGINYEYEKHYPLQPEDRQAQFSSYHPDFYLTDYDIWHEHLGIDRDGNVPGWFSSKHPYKTARETYHAGILWKEGIHTKYATTLIKTHSFENKEGTLIANLKKRLLEKGVVLKERNPEEILALVRKSPHFEDFINLIYTFLQLMKANGQVPENVTIDRADKRSTVFLDVFKPIYYQYQQRLSETSQVDFNDMINQASSHFNNGEFTKAYKYILVDEFQDMSLGRYELLKGLRKQNPDVKLYAVGDDWQSIFRFTGSDISIITEFEQHFGFTSQTSILKTYRFNDQILKVSSEFIQKNPAQLRKVLKSDRLATGDSFAFISSDTMGNTDAKEMQIRMLLDEIYGLKQNAEVYLIGRYHHNAPTRLRTLKSDYPSLTIEYHTAHRVKGMTCDYSILLDVDSGPLGFPSEIADDPLLNYLLHEGDNFENAEERRVFYVAITRARHKNYLLYNAVSPSKFLLELMQGESAGNTRRLKCPECQGALVKRSGPYSEFYGCSNYPQCEGKLPMVGSNVS